MAKLEIIDVPHPTLKKIAVEIAPEEINENLRQFIADMIETSRGPRSGASRSSSQRIQKTFGG